MADTTFKIGKKEYVILSRRRYEQLTRAEQDEKDSKMIRNAVVKYERGTLETISLEEAQKMWAKAR